MGVTYIFKGQDEKKKEYRLDSAQNFDRASRSKNSPIGIPHNLCKRRILAVRDLHRYESIYPSSVCNITRERLVGFGVSWDQGTYLM